MSKAFLRLPSFMPSFMPFSKLSHCSCGAIKRADVADVVSNLRLDLLSFVAKYFLDVSEDVDVFFE